MSTRANSKLSRFLSWPYWGCGLPFVGVGLVFFYLVVFSIYRFWGVGAAASPPTDVSKFYFGALTTLLHNLGDPRSLEIYNAITAKQMVVWGYETGLVGLSLFFAIAISAYVVFRALRGWPSRRKWLLTASILGFCLVVYPYISRELGLFNNFTVIARQLWGLIHFQLHPHPRFPHIVDVEMIVVALGYGVSMLLAFASAATLWPLRELEVPQSSISTEEIEDGAKYLSMQMRHLRLILYAGAILLLVIAFRHSMTQNWALEYLKPVPLLEGHPTYKYANLIYGHLQSLITNNLLATSVMNTLLLAAFYVPSALLLQRRARSLLRLGAAKEKSAEESAWQDEWLKSRQLIFPFKEHLPKVIAILSPLLAGPLGELLNFFR